MGSSVVEYIDVHKPRQSFQLRHQAEQQRNSPSVKQTLTPIETKQGKLAYEAYCSKQYQVFPHLSIANRRRRRSNFLLIPYLGSHDRHCPTSYRLFINGSRFFAFFAHLAYFYRRLYDIAIAPGFEM